MTPPRILTLVAVLAVAGCLTAAGPATDGTADDRTPTATARPLPERPASLTAESATRFVVAYEQAYAWNEMRTPNTTDLNLEPVTSWANESRDGYRVHVEVGVSHYQRAEGGGEMVGDGYYTAVYFVNDSALFRARAGGAARPGPDPRDGTVLEAAAGE